MRAADLAYLRARSTLPGTAEGGDIGFALDFPSAGMYRALLQFASGDAVQTAGFTVQVAP